MYVLVRLSIRTVRRLAPRIGTSGGSERNRVATGRSIHGEAVADPPDGSHSADLNRVTSTSAINLIFAKILFRIPDAPQDGARGTSISGSRDKAKPQQLPRRIFAEFSLLLPRARCTPARGRAPDS